MIFHLLDRWDTPVQTVKAISARHSEQINGEDTLVIETMDQAVKGDRVLWQDHLGKWHEHIVDTVVKQHSEGRPVSTLTCINSIAETFNDYVDYLEMDWRETGGSPRSAAWMLGQILTHTRWTLGSGTIDKTGAVTLYHSSAREGIQKVQEAVGGELKTAVSVGNSRVLYRYVTVVPMLGDQASPKRFTWTKDLRTISRRVESDECVSQLYVYGKSESSDSRGFSRRVSIDSVNDGKKYLESASALDLWGRPGTDGGKVHATGYVEFDEIEDPTELLAAGREEFAKRQTPKLSYTMDVVDLASMGFTYEGVGLGDAVAIVDAGFEPALRASGRVTRIERDLLGRDAVVTIGNVTEDLASMLRRQAEAVGTLVRRADTWSKIAKSDAAYLDELRSALNSMFETNGSYQYESFERGSLWSNVPCDEDTFSPVQPLPAGVTPWAMNIGSAGFRIASELNANGTWKWSTFGTGEGFVADYITAGVIQSAAYRATGQGDHWIIGQNGYLETYSSKFHQSDITNADIDNADITNGTIDDAAITNGTIDNAAITNGTITSAEIDQASIDDADITNSTMTNATVSGTFSTGSGSYATKLQDAQLKGFYNDTNLGYIDYSAVFHDESTGELAGRGLKIYGRQMASLTTPWFGVAKSSSEGATVEKTFTGTVRQPIVTSIRDNGGGSITWTSGTLEMEFIHGMLVGITTVGT